MEKRTRIEILAYGELNITNDDDLDSEKGRAEFTNLLRDEVKIALAKLGPRYGHSQEPLLKDVDFEMAYDDEGGYQYKKKGGYAHG